MKKEFSNQRTLTITITITFDDFQKKKQQLFILWEKNKNKIVGISA